MAVKVAIAETTAMGMMQQPIVGTAMKSMKPVNLLAIVCGKQNRLIDDQG